MKKSFLVDSSKCIGCNTCAMACKNQNHTASDIAWRSVHFVGESYPESANNRLPYGAAGNGEFSSYEFASRGDYFYRERAFVSLACNHCEDPACAKICPAGAYEKRADGIVVHNQEACIGCKGCVNSCPFEAPKFNAELQKAEKCSMCYERQDDGKEPACVQSCPVEALKLVDLDKGEVGVKNPQGVKFAVDTEYKPTTRFVLPKKPKKEYRLA